MPAPQNALEFSETLPLQHEQWAPFSLCILGTNSFLSKYLGGYLHVLFLEGIFIFSESLVAKKKKKTNSER